MENTFPRKFLLIIVLFENQLQHTFILAKWYELFVQVDGYLRGELGFTSWPINIKSKIRYLHNFDYIRYNRIMSNLSFHFCKDLGSKIHPKIKWPVQMMLSVMVCSTIVMIKSIASIIFECLMRLYLEWTWKI